MSAAGPTFIIIVIIIIYLFVPSGVKCPRVKNIELKASELVSSINVPRKAIELNHWIIILILWWRNARSRGSSEISANLLL